MPLKDNKYKEVRRSARKSYTKTEGLHGRSAGKELKIRNQPVVGRGYHAFERILVRKSRC